MLSVLSLGRVAAKSWRSTLHRRNLSQLTRVLSDSRRNISHPAASECLRGPFSWPAANRSFSTEVSPREETHEFKAETRKLLSIVAHSLYTDKEVFIRELISNASDSLEKLRFLQASGQLTNIVDPDLPLEIFVSGDAASRTFTIRDTGIGMDRDELVDNLGTIARSGSKAFLEDPSIDAKDQANAIIGQFGVGFYSSFVVADSVEVYSRSADPAKGDQGWSWKSDGSGSFTIKPCDNLSRGTSIVCHLKDDCSKFSSPNLIKESSKKFSSFLSFPLYLEKEANTGSAASAPASDAAKDDEGEQLSDSESEKSEKVVVGEKERERISTQDALWLKSSATPEEHKDFFKYVSGQPWGEPLYSLIYHTDVPLAIKSALYFPAEAPSRLFQKSIEVGVNLHSRRILVKKAADNVVPRWLYFVKGVVDCDDVPLNISRESMQDTRLIQQLSNTIVRRLLKLLEDEAKKDHAHYCSKFYSQYSYYLKEGLLEDLQAGGKFKDQLLKLLRFESNQKSAKELISLDDYVASMKPKQENIYYLCASDRKTAMASPYMEDFTRRNRHVLLLMEDIDEFVMMHVQNYSGKKLVAVDSPEGNFEPLLEDDIKPDSDNASSLQGEQRTELEEYIKGVLGKRISAVKFSDRLTHSPAVVSGFLSPAIRKMMKASMRGMGGGEDQDAFGSLPATLELNPSHRVVTSLYHLRNRTPEVAGAVTEQLYDNACIAAGILDDPKSMLDRLNNLLEITAQYAYHHVAAVPAEAPEAVESENDAQPAQPSVEAKDTVAAHA